MTRERLIELLKEMLYEERWCDLKARLFKSSVRSQRKRIDEILDALNFDRSTILEVSNIIPDCSIDYAVQVLNRRNVVTKIKV